MKITLYTTGILSVIALLLLTIQDNKPEERLAYATVTCASVAPDVTEDWYKTDNVAPLFEGLGTHEFTISTQKKLVQQYFNQGLVLAYGFNHAEAARSFYYASKLDPNCAMAYWGYAYVLGPNYNVPMDDNDYPKAHNAMKKAVELKENCTPKEKALIDAMQKRYENPSPEDRSSMDKAYAGALKKAVEMYPNDADIGTLYVEAIMDMHPWDLWDKNGTPKAWTPEIVSTLEKILERDPKHPGANHFYIHAVEASKHPERGLNSARLYDEGLVPNAGHLVHMPSHIYIRTGHYHKGTLSNIQAVKADSSYTTACHAQGVYPLAYYPHNYHFMAATATLEGNQKWAILAANKLSKQVDKQLMTEPGWGTLQHFYSIPYFVYVKFGAWDDILKMKDEKLNYPKAIQTYARGMAFLGKKDLLRARNELNKLRDYANDKSFKSLTIWDINSVYELVQIAYKVLEGEILASESHFDESIQRLKEAVKIEDNLNYNEPPDWFFSVRHNLGAVQIEAKNYKDAVQTFNEDLEEYPRNGWALHGIRLAYTKLNETQKVSETQNQIKDIWATADTEISNARIK